MNQIPIRLGPLALLLSVISICLTTLSILTFTTASADLRLAEKYAETVRIRYELEKEGQLFLQEAEDAAAGGLLPGEIPGTEPVPEGGARRTFEKDGTILTVVLAPKAGAAARFGAAAEGFGAEDRFGAAAGSGAEDRFGAAAEGSGAEARFGAAAGEYGRMNGADPEGTVAEEDPGRPFEIVEWTVVRSWTGDDSIGNIWIPE